MAFPIIAPAGELQWQKGRTAFAGTQTNARPNVDCLALSTVCENGSDGLRLASGAEGGLQFRSVVKPGSDAPPIRSAQLPFGDDESAADAAEMGEVRSDTLPENDLFAPMPGELPPLDEPQDIEFDTPSQPETAPLQLEPRQQQPFNGRAPTEPTQMPRPDALDAYPGSPLPETVPTPSASTMETERKLSEEACDQGVADLQAKTIDTLSLSIAVTGEPGSDYPFECSLDDEWHEGRYWDETIYMWKASALCHKPLYFEDEHLERYGHSWPPCCQPFVSGAHFFTRLPILPYCMGVEPPQECIYALGHYRPGSCAPYMCNPVPLSARGALFQAGAVVGAAAVLP